MKRVSSEEIEIGISGIRKLTDTIKSVCGYDISVYASTSLKRRIVNVINKNDLGSLEGLINLFNRQPSFLDTFIFQMSVEGTEFFRDPAFWRYFKNEICSNFKRNITKIKIWIPGCSSGEEVVSTAIVLQEAGLDDKAIIFATDQNNEILEFSRNKLYSNTKLEISENNYKRVREDEQADLSKYVVKEPAGFRFKDNVYKNVVYDIFNEPENKNIKNVNMVLCRNYFIYYTTKYQEQLLEMFTKRLSHNGYLVTGNKENISFCKDASKYTYVNENEKIFRKITI